MFGVERLDFDTVMGMATKRLNKDGYYYVHVLAHKPGVGTHMAQLVTFILWVHGEVLVNEVSIGFKVTLS